MGAYKYNFLCHSRNTCIYLQAEKLWLDVIKNFSQDMKIHVSYKLEETNTLSLHN